MAGHQGGRENSGVGAAGSASLVVRGGKVFDPVAGRFNRLDILALEGKVARMAPTVEAPEDSQVVDASGLLVTPGLVDCHVHAFRWGHLISLDVDPVSSQSGVTTFVDGGSAGSLQFMAFRRFVIDHVRSNLYALLNVSALGETVDGLKGVDAWENDDLRFLHLDSAVETVEKNRDLIVGIKVRIHTGLASLLPMAAGRALADAVGLPLVVHTMKAPPLFSDLLPYLKAGDVVTHMYHPGPGCLVDAHGRIAPEYLEARRRGVLFDTGTARFHTCHPVARAAIAEGFLPDTISTDLCLTNYQHITIDMPTTLTKFMALGLSVEQVLQRATIEPAKSLPAERGHGRLAEGLTADIGLFAIEDGEFTYHDFFGNPLPAGRRLVCRGTIKDGRLLTPEAQEPMPFDFMRR
ncbi:MAG: amidohydrolase [candidate division NC10 bacterium]|nr:amidohydrolase [candidate division NC10 bacterium]